jgi:RNA polymerase-interacting CarD/CdnL/TRCF family regulator
MEFHNGDPVMHWTYGFGHIVQLEERTVSGERTLYYAVQVRDLTIWVPADGKLESRLRPPTPEAKFNKLLALLTSPGEPLPDDRQERKLRLQEQLRDGRAESLCRVIRDLYAYRQTKSPNDNAQALLKRSRDALLGEWAFALSIPPAQADLELERLLPPMPAVESRR